MKVLEMNWQIFVHIFHCPAPDGTKLKEIISYFILSASMTIVLFLGGVSGGYFCLSNLKTDLESALYAFYISQAAFCAFYMNLTSLFYRSKLSNIFTELQNICDEWESRDIEGHLARANAFTQKISVFFYEVPRYYLTFFAMAIMSYIYYMIRDGFGSVDADDLFRPTRFTLPWNQHHVLGWIAEIIFDYILGISWFLVTFAWLSFFVGICAFHRAFYLIFRRQVREIGQLKKNDEIEARLRDLVELHVSVKNKHIAVTLISGTILLACSLFALDMAFKHLTLNVFIFGLSGSCGAIIPFVYCYYGNITTDNYLRFTDILYESEWFKLSINLQKYYLLMIENAQRPLWYHGFNVVYLKLETFCRILKAVISYYMIFKTLVEK